MEAVKGAAEGALASFLDEAIERIRPAVSRRIAVAGGTIDLHFAGEALAETLFPTLSHVEVPVGGHAADARLFVADAATLTLPPRPFDIADQLPQGILRQVDGERFRATFVAGLTLYDSEQRRGLFWAPAGPLPYWERSSPFRWFLHWFAREQGFHLTHAASIGTERGAALLVGKGGSGKSTSALAALGSDFLYAGDDYVVVRDRQPIVQSLYSWAKLEPGHLGRLPWLQQAVRYVPVEEGEKALIDTGVFPANLAREIPLAAIVVPHVVGTGETTIEPLSRALALRALAPSTILQHPGAAQESLRFLASLVGSLPAFRLSLGSDIRGIPAVVASVLP